MGATNYTSYTPLGYVSVSATSSTAIALSANLPAAAAASATTARPLQPTTPDLCIIRPETAGIRFRDDNVAAVNAASGGFPIAALEAMEYDGYLTSGASFVSQSGTATVHLLFYRTH